MFCSVEVWYAIPEISQESEHFMAFDLRWSGADEVLKELRGPSKALAEANETCLYQDKLREHTTFCLTVLPARSINDDASIAN